MTLNTFPLTVAIALGLSFSGAAQAEGYYGTGFIGGNFQATDSEPYGNNIAVDPDFPGEFDAGDGFVGGVGVGYDFGNQFRVEGRLAFRNSDFNETQFGTGARDGEEYILDGSFQSTSITLEGFYGIETGSDIKPYVKAGIGVSRNDYDARLGGAGVAAFDAFDGTADGFYDNYADGSSTEFAWNVGFGASYVVDDQITLFGEYQYVSAGAVETGQDSFTDGFGIDSTSHELLIGIRTSF